MWYDDIKKQFTDVVMYSQRNCFRYFPTFNFDSLFEEWARNKNNIRNMTPFFYEGNLIYEYPEPVCFDLNEDTKRERLDRFVRELWDFPDLKNFLDENKSNFFENRIVTDYKAPYGIARRGMKIIKAFKLFFKDDEENLKRLQAEASAIMNEDKIEGTFCLSIHPLDYISISDNDHHWHTCHSMDSDYRVGNFNYMADKHTIICYVKTGVDRKISNFPYNVPWNSKKWRMLLFFDEHCNFVMAGKQYPLESTKALDFFQEAWKGAYYDSTFYKDGKVNKFYMARFSPWHRSQISSVTIDNHEYVFPEPMIPIGRYMAPIHKIYVPGNNTHQYNDILQNHKYKKTVPYAYLTQKDGWAFYDGVGIAYPELNNASIDSHLFAEIEMPIIKPGLELYCPVCGLDSVNTGDAIVCDHCAIKYYDHNILDEDYFPACDCCGERFIHYEGHWREGQHFCENCAKEYGPEVWEYKEDK